MPTMQCPHCRAENITESQYCHSCGMAISVGNQTAPRLIEKEDLAATGAGRRLQQEELWKMSRKASIALFIVAGMQIVVGIIVGAALLGNSSPGADPEEKRRAAMIMTSILVGIGVIFLVLGFWARRSPLPASSLGLAFFVTIHTLDALADPSTLVRGWLIKLIVILMLINAINASLKHKQLRAMEAAEQS
jgi:hypothetical protein